MRLETATGPEKLALFVEIEKKLQRVARLAFSSPPAAFPADKVKLERNSMSKQRPAPTCAPTKLSFDLSKTIAKWSADSGVPAHNSP